VPKIIGHLKAEHRIGRNYLAHNTGDAINAVLAAVEFPPPAQVAGASLA